MLIDAFQLLFYQTCIEKIRHAFKPTALCLIALLTGLNLISLDTQVFLCMRIVLNHCFVDTCETFFINYTMLQDWD